MVCMCCVTPYLAGGLVALLAALTGVLSRLFAAAVQRVRHASTSLARRVLRALRTAGAPRSVAFIMDGNRRWARARGRPGFEGHPRGGDTLADVLQWCLDAGVRVVTVYAFSNENFKRSDEEVGEIFKLAHDRVLRMLEETDLVQRHRVRVNVLGDLPRLPEKLRRAFACAMRQTREYGGGDGLTLNICFAYTAREEMAQAVSTAVRLCDEGKIQEEDIDEQLLASCLYTGLVLDERAAPQVVDGKTPMDTAAFGYPDLIVRTSGEIRLSDFLLMQASDAVVSFQPVLWPDLTAWHMVKIVLDYQAQRRAEARLERAGSVVYSAAAKSSATFHLARVQSAISAVRSAYIEKIDVDADEAAKEESEMESKKETRRNPESGGCCGGPSGCASRANGVGGHPTTAVRRKRGGAAESALGGPETSFNSPLSSRAL